MNFCDLEDLVPNHFGQTVLDFDHFRALLKST